MTRAAPRTLGNFGTLSRLFGYLWPKDSVDLRVRVVLAMVCLVAAKVAVVFVPVFYKDAVDALTGDSVSGVVALPVAIVLSYGAARVLSLAFGELRDAIFARVGQRAIRQVALEVFRHLHAMSLRFHVDRQTGGLVAHHQSRREPPSKCCCVSACSTSSQRWSKLRWCLASCGSRWISTLPLVTIVTVIRLHRLYDWW